jgi:hypothetical protein
MRRTVLALIVLVAATVVSTASASQVVSTSTVTGLKLGVNSKGEAMLTYKSAGKTIRVLATGGAVNAIAPTQSRPQLALTLAYDGGYKQNYTQNPAAKEAIANLRALQLQMSKATAAGDNKTRYALKPKISAAFAALAKLRAAATNYWQSFTCPAYDGPDLAWKVTACKAPDGSYWAVQSWQRQLPNYGVAPTEARQTQWEVHLAHWTGDLPVLTIETNWAYKKFDHLFGSFTYDGSGVYGFHSTPAGQPLDTFGRNLYVDTFDSAYGAGWKRENSFLMHKSTGAFCYGFFAHAPHPIGAGTKYRATIIGPGLTPDIMWEGTPPGPFDATAQLKFNDDIRALGDPTCKPV